MHPDRQNSKTIFLIFMLVALVGYFILPLPRLRQDVSHLKREAITKQVGLVKANEREVLPAREIINEGNPEDPLSPSYLVCSIDDDPEATNAYGIYDPTDLAVTVNNLHRLGITHLFLGMHLHWPDLPPVENNTLSSQLELLDSCILSTPLRRARESMDIPKYLLDASVPLAEVKGNALTLPKVNSLSLAPTLKIPKNCKVGFSRLESEPETDNIPLLAVWGDRVILSSLLLERMHHLGISKAAIQIKVGEYILLGDTGNAILIDEFGYFIPQNTPGVTEPHIISADITSVKESPFKTGDAILSLSLEG